MNPVSYHTIAPNIAEVSVDGAQVQVSWKCPASGRTVGNTAATMVADPSLAARVGASAKRTLVSEVIYGAARLLSGLVGGTAGRVLRSAAYTAAADLNSRATSGVDFTEASRQAAILLAFESVRPLFAWDENRQQFVAR